ncbi:MAG: C1 family peptidase [Candidatus Dormibacteraeota bacterium]|nr:C1 family peptidase [Candidatus Dormibacteraeota bacterium]
MPHRRHHYGWLADSPDDRDHRYAAPRVRGLPTRVDLRLECPPVYNQGPLGSCTANAIAGAIQFEQMKRHRHAAVPARLFIYYNERSTMGMTGFDCGAPNRDGIKTVAKQGVCDELVWSYDITKFREEPPHSCYAAASRHRVGEYQRLAQSLEQLRGCLADGHPFVFGFLIYESFEHQAVITSGHAAMPAATEKQLGGHAVLGVGYDDVNQRFLVRNSWGTNWGLRGYFTLPYAYLTDQDLASDFWTIRLV